MDELFEAARWAASANNEQPWQYVYAHRGTPAFEQLWNCLKPWSTHDVGMANAQLMLQAAQRDIYGHMMAGFDASQTAELLELSEEQRPVCMIALGYLGEADQLEEPYKTRELTPRNRLSITEFTRQL